jgi:hypothetical protein
VPSAALNSLPLSLLSPRPSRRRVALAVTAAVLAVHLLLLSRAGTAPGSDRRETAAPPMQVRHIVVPAANETANAATTATRPAAAPVAAPRPRSVPPPRKSAGVESGIETRATPEPPAPSGTPLPAYATRLPPPMTLHYSVRQGSATGQAALHWHPAGDRYRLTLERSGQDALGSDSQGRLGAAGLTPERYVESRRGREQRAVNFQHEAGRITFSGPQLQYPLLPGAQDRLSWMLQLPAVLEAGPALREPGSEVLIFVAGTRGDGQVWTFTVQGRHDLEASTGSVTGALHLRRAAARPYDSQVDVWLDPGRHHLPVRVLLQFPPASGSTDWALEEHGAR